MSKSSLHPKPQRDGLSVFDRPHTKRLATATMSSKLKIAGLNLSCMSHRKNAVLFATKFPRLREAIIEAAFVWTDFQSHDQNLSRLGKINSIYFGLFIIRSKLFFLIQTFQEVLSKKKIFGFHEL